MKIIFHSNQLCERGTEIALYQYAHYNETILGNESFIFFKDPDIYKYSNPLIIKKFKDRFINKVFSYKNFTEVQKKVDDLDIDIFYAIKSGINDGVYVKNAKNIIHAVFQNYEPHGDVYAYVSEWLSNKMTNNKIPFVPHMVEPIISNDDMRKELNIPEDAIVFGRHGGKDTFQIKFVHESIKETLKKDPSKYFIFLNTNKFYEHKNIIYLDTITNNQEKNKFINTCDAMIHARTQGESFGLSIAEFSIQNKPIITWTGGRDRAHLDILEKKGIYYSNQKQLVDILLNFKVNESINWDCYSEKYSPEVVMKKFKEVFLDK